MSRVRIVRISSFLALLSLSLLVMGAPAFAQQGDQPPGQQETPPDEPPGQNQTPPGQGPAEEDHGEDENGEAAETDDRGGEPQGVAARGTVKVEETPMEAETANEVHAGCDFGLSFWGFREQTAPVVFTLQPPSGTDEIATREVSLSEARGNELSGTLQVDLTNELAAYAPAQASSYDYKIRVDVVIAERGESGVISKSAMVFLDCPEAATMALAAGFERLPVSGAASAAAPAAAAPAAAGPAPGQVPVGGVEAGAGGTADGGTPLLPLAVLAMAFSAVMWLRRATTA